MTNEAIKGLEEAEVHSDQSRKKIEEIRAFRDPEKRKKMFYDSLKFAHKVLVTDDGHLITVCRALIPEYSFLADQEPE